MNRRILLVFLFLTFVSLGTTIAILQSKIKQKPSKHSESTPELNPTPPTNPYQATFIANTLSPTITNIILKSFDFEINNLNAYQLEISFNPHAIKILSLSPGNIWPQINLLSQNINNQTGTANISIGKGFQTQATNNNILAIIEYQIIDPGLSPEITILNNSKLAISGYSTSPQITVE